MPANRPMRFALLIALLAPSLTTADEVPFPFAAVDRHAAMIGYVDLGTIDAARLQATAKAILGDGAGVLDEAIKNLDAMTSALRKAGAERIYVTWSPPTSRAVAQATGQRRDPFGQIFVRHAAGTDVDALRGMLKEMTGGIAFAPAEARWISANPDNDPIAAGLPADRIKAMTDRLKGAAGTSGGFAMVMTDDAHDGVRSLAPPVPADFPADRVLPMTHAMVDLAAAMGDAKAMSGGFGIGAEPVVTLRVHANDAPAAKSMVETLTALRDAMSALQRQAAEAGQPLRGEMAMMSLLGGSLLNPKAEGPVVTNTITADSIKEIAPVIAGAIGAARANAARVASMNNIKQILVAIHIHAADNGGALPDSLDDLVTKGYMAKNVFANPNTGSNPGYEYVSPGGKLADLANPAATPLIYELRDGKRVPNGLVGYADGHVTAE